MVQPNGDHSELGEVQEDNDHFARHGGVHFKSNVSPEEINLFIRRLPAGKRESLFEVLDELDRAGLIQIVNDHVFTDGNGVIGGGE
ncbi:hypothetical protein [Brevibacillus massiliensis]|jgi:hypothetical protein|uniref:hypothetical protein n=1 Tax=Brevibacillus massiliensis TaxID=1118054 RepID=UPI0002D2A35E